MIASGKQPEMLDKIYGSYANYRDDKTFVLVQVGSRLTYTAAATGKCLYIATSLPIHIQSSVLMALLVSILTLLHLITSWLLS